MANQHPVLAVLAWFGLAGATLHAQGTAFTYQGRLNSSGAPANGSYDMAFTLFTTKVAGSAFAGPVTNAAVAVTNGLFTTTVDFGAVFSGTNTWLALAVSTNGANAFSTLAPRQPLTPVPYAVTAENVSGAVNASQLSGIIPQNDLSGLFSNPLILSSPANSFTGNGAGLQGLNASALSGLLSASVQVNASQLTGTVPDGLLSANVALRAGGNAFNGTQTVINGNLGIGTTTANHALVVQADDSGTQTDAQQFIIQGNANSDQQLEVGYKTISNYGSIQAYQQLAGARTLVLQPAGGNVGIGATNATSPLTVNGNIQLGAGGGNYAASGPENLRLVRGIVNSAGQVVTGSGFTSATNGSLGSYTLTFTPAFSGIPAVTASGVHAPVLVGGYISSNAITLQTTYGSSQSDTFSFIAIGPE